MLHLILWIQIMSLFLCIADMLNSVTGFIFQVVGLKKPPIIAQVEVSIYHQSSNECFLFNLTILFVNN